MSGSAFYTAVSGLKSNQTKLDVIANNIANINTFGFKSSRVTFSDLLSQMISAPSSPQGSRGGTNPMQIGLGVKLASIDTIMRQGSIQNTGNPRDLAIDGDGFFIVNGEAGTRYTRTGNFTFDYNGTLLTVDGLRVQGYTALTPNGLSIDTNSEIGDIRVNFGEKLQARPTTLTRFRSNLDATSNIYGTSELTSPGSTGFTLAAGTMVPISELRGITIDDGSVTPLSNSVAGNRDLVINGQEIVYSWPAGWTWGDSQANAQFIANAINSQSPTAYAFVGTDNNIIIQSMFGGAQNDLFIDGDDTTVGFLESIGLAAGTYSAPEASSALAGNHKLTVTDATYATATTFTPVQAGELTSDTFFINDVEITYPATDENNTSAENAQIIADAINNAVGLNITAIANANGTITLRSDLAGKNNIIAIENEGTALSVIGFDTLGTLQNNPFPDPPGSAAEAYVIDNGSDANVSNVFTSDDGTNTWTRIFYDVTAYGSESKLSNLMNYMLGDNPAMALIPGVTLTSDNLVAGSATVMTYNAFEHLTSINVFDSLGNPHFLTVKFTHVGENQWDWVADLPQEPNLGLTGNTGTIIFDSRGMIISPNPTIPISFTSPGSDEVEIFLEFDGEGNPLSGITQFGSPTSTRAEFQDGYQSGILQAIAFDPNGVLRASFSNGQIRPLAQIAVANFNNPEGLERTGNNTFNASANSGLAIISVPLKGGAGSIVPGALEQSNVDLANEFTDMIVSQRGFQANSRVITTQDSIMAEALNLVR